MFGCRLPAVDAAPMVLQLLRQSGCVFYWGRKQDPAPEQRIRTKSIIAPMDFTHSLLARSLLSDALRSKLGFASLGFIAHGKCVRVGNSPRVERELDNFADGLLAFAKLQYAIFRPSYGWIDELGDNAPSRTAATPGTIKFLFWANIFGPRIVKQVGAEFLRNCPARVEWLDDGGALVVSRSGYTKWLERRDTRLVNHLTQKFPNISLFRSAGVEC
jgi:hypothetical protein